MMKVVIIAEKINSTMMMIVIPAVKMNSSMTVHAILARRESSIGI
jgi:hypothetical protein